MMFLSRMSDAMHTPVIVGEFYDNGTVLVSTPRQEALILDRSMIETPVLCCPECLKPVITRHPNRTKQEVAECPDHAKHMYEKLFTASKDTVNYNRESRKRMHNSARKWLKKFQGQHLGRMKADARLPEGTMRHPHEGRLIAEEDYINEHLKAQPSATFTIKRKH